MEYHDLQDHIQRLRRYADARYAAHPENDTTRRTWCNDQNETDLLGVIGEWAWRRYLQVDDTPYVLPHGDGGGNDFFYLGLRVESKGTKYRTGSLILEDKDLKAAIVVFTTIVKYRSARLAGWISTKEFQQTSKDPAGINRDWRGRYLPQSALHKPEALLRCRNAHSILEYRRQANLF